MENIKIKLRSAYEYCWDTLQILHPRFWEMLGEYSSELDWYINENIGKISKVGASKVKVGELDLWVGNYPFSYLKDFHSRSAVTGTGYMPSRRTVLKVGRMLGDTTPQKFKLP
jgi:hypothetical protein